jgi:mono/diheme cytochrome c family protein
MKRFGFLFSSMILLVGMLFAWQSQQADASGLAQQTNTPRGGALYDKWYAVIGKDAPAGNQPIWLRQTTNTLSGADTWRCVSCHGWDYQGKDGAYRSGSNFTGFPGLLDSAKKLSKDEVVASLSGKNDPGHDFSKYMAASDLNDLADFVKNGLIDDNAYINPQTLDVIGGDSANGKKLYDSSCGTCHGQNGDAKNILFEGKQAGLGTLAAIDPWRFLHKTRFGTPGTEMPLHAATSPAWIPQDGRDVLAYVQRNIKTGQETPNPSGALSGHETPSANPGGPANGVFGGFLTAIGAVTTGVGFAVLLGAVLVIIIFLVVWTMRDRK